MREIKFRAQYQGKIYDVTELRWSDNMAYLWGEGEDEEPGEVPLNEIELLQFTGMKDSREAEIYEGDIVSTYVRERRKVAAKTGVIAWDEYELSFNLYDDEKYI